MVWLLAEQLTLIKKYCTLDGPKDAQREPPYGHLAKSI
jgi:hypothetical protein